MLWCKATFNQHFSEHECRLFPTQQQLFDFLDEHTCRGSEKGTSWLPFSIEFPSERDVARKLSWHSSRSGGLFSKPPTSGDQAAAEKGAGPVKREDFSLVYGETTLSPQTRFFLAATQDGLQEILHTVEPRQRHLYELIRFGSRCHLYFDVERVPDCVALHDEVNLCDDVVEIEPTIVATVAGRAGRRIYRATPKAYSELVGCLPSIPGDVCRLDCPVQADNTQTSFVLLRELQRFIAESYPQWLSVDTCERPQMASLPCLPTPARPSPPTVFFDEVLVMASVSVDSARPDPAKFSQHYVLKRKGACFSDTLSMGHFVRQFVSFLSEKAACDREVHAALFYHGEPIAVNALPTISEDQPSPAVPFLKRLCVIDTAVYSKNRMMRCLGSCKLGKLNVLVPHQRYLHGSEVGVDAGELWTTFCDSLISVQGDTTPLHVPLADVPPSEPVGYTGQRQSSRSYHVDADSRVRETSRGQEERVLEVVYSEVSGCACRVRFSRQLSPRFSVFQVEGTRYCLNVHREHKSNNVYLVVDHENGSWHQKCFDPDCGRFRSGSFPLSLPKGSGSDRGNACEVTSAGRADPEGVHL